MLFKVFIVLVLLSYSVGGFLLNENEGCPDGWTVFGQHCYFYNIFKKPWMDAQTTCENLGGHLATIEDYDEDKFIEQFIIQSKTLISDLSSSYTWVGATDQIKEGTWLWVTGKPVNMTVYSNWRGPGPNNAHHGSHTEDCMDWSAGGWNDNDCASAFNFICEKALCTNLK